MAITYKNVADDYAFKQDREKFFKSIPKKIDDFIKSGNNPFSRLDDDEIELKTEYSSIGDLLKTWKNAISKVKGDVLIFFGDEKSDVSLKPTGFSVDNDSLIINLDIDNESEVKVIDFIKQIKSQLTKFYLKDNSRFKFNFRGNALDIERVVLLCYDEDSPTFLVEFNSSQVSSKKTAVKAACTVKDLLDQINVFCDEHVGAIKSWRDSTKVVCLVNDNGKQQAFQIRYPHEQGSQVIFNLVKCPFWRFKEIVNDPETMTVTQLQDCVRKMQDKNGCIFMKAKDQTYGISGIDMLESGSSFDDEGSHEMVALLLKPWSELFESKHTARKMKNMKKKYTKKQILESIKYWKKQLDRMDESLRVSLADKQSATQALLDHNDELTEFIDQKPHPTKDELIQFVADIFKEEGLDTPWTKQFLIKMKMYTHSWDDAVQYLWNARLKGQKLGMDQGLYEGEELESVNEDISCSGTFYNLIDELREYVLELKDYTYELQKLVKASDLNSHRSKFEVLSDSMTESLGELARFFAG